MIWTTQKPTQSGWYWWRLEKGKPEVVVEVRDPSYLEDERDAEWSSMPIDPSEEG